MLKENYLKKKLRNGQCVIGTWSIMPSFVVADVIATTGIDFLIIDSEHGPISFETAQGMAIACESRGVSPVMRVSGVNEADILKALDIGVHCIQVPNVVTQNNIRDIMRYAKYPPKGNRGFSPFTRAGNYSLEQAKDLTALANDNVMLAVHIEGKDAIENISNILKVEEIEIIFIGIFDISKSLGIPGDITNPKIIDTLKFLVDEITEAGKYAGTIANNKDQLRQYIDLGVKYITYSVDCEVLSSAYKNIVGNFKAIGEGRNG